MRIYISIISIFLTTFLQSYAGDAYATTHDTLVRPRIGLVLSGGSAHGLAHIGVIQYLEEMGIRPDYITGTSMGAVIGGLYAMGYNTKQLKEITSKQDWSQIIGNVIPMKEVSPIEKLNHQKIPFTLKWKNNKLSLPASLIRSQKLDLNLSMLFAPAYNINNFDSLPIPFRCVTVDLINGTIFTLGEGNLGNAIRASMSIPSVFAPVEHEGGLLVDGGLVRNFPVEENIQMGADIIIGVYVGSYRAEKENIVSLLDVLRLSTFMPSILDSEKQFKLVDILLEPDVKDYGLFDFDRYEEFIYQGYLSAKFYEDELRKLVDTLSLFPEEERRSILEHPKSLYVNEIVSNEKDIYLKEMILNSIEVERDSIISIPIIEKCLSAVYGTKHFKGISYTLRPSDNEGTVDLYLNSKDVDRFTVGLSLNRFKNYNAGIIASAELRNVLLAPTSLRVDLRLSERPGVMLDYQYRLRKKPDYIMQFLLKAERMDIPFFTDQFIDRIYKYSRVSSEIYFYKEIGSSFLVGVNYNFETNTLLPQVFKSVDFDKLTSRRHKVGLSANLNTIDQRQFPNSGYDVSSDLYYTFKQTLDKRDRIDEDIFLEIPFNNNSLTLSVNSKTYFSLSSKIVLESSLGARFATADVFFNFIQVGGAFDEKRNTLGFLGLDDGELLIGNFVQVKQGLRHKLFNNIYLTTSIHYLYGQNFGSLAFDVLEKEISVIGAGIKLGVKTPIGPIYLELGASNRNKSGVLNLGVGYRYII
jgi:NTE family protein